MKKLIFVATLLLAPVFAFAADVQNLKIEAQGQDQYYNYNFGTVFVNSRHFVDFTLSATGDEPTVIRRIWISGAMYSADTNCPEILNPGEKCTARVFFWPYAEGHHWGELTFVLGQNNIYIRLFGATWR
ncbi:hypothetical protein QJS83_03510 [Bdellovibrio sp. 22V]|uniref:hypothetical protein n=1 Tax=Bdellovibrio TaxID=958 RepID=UPI0025432295|nr:hypothetical protein [Bdellovibrio sp. 22V]WII72937.1 hypothetical protein QJS83_03510 [Bdellovibrio sp. 22V]